MVTYKRFDAHEKKLRVKNPPSDVVKILLGKGDWRFHEVVGVVDAPTLRPDGSILDRYGYDPATRLWCNSRIKLPTIPLRPTRAQAKQAPRLYRDLLTEFPFVGKVDWAVALAGIMTAVLRAAFALAPMSLIRAHEIGTGKSFLVDLIAYIITGRACPVMPPGEDNAEMEKRLASMLLEGGAILSLDNLSRILKSIPLLNQILTQETVKPRILGKSSIPECEWRGTLFATGNNIIVDADLVRRVLVCNLDAKCERPEQRKFPFNPIERVLENRAAYIAAAIIISRAYQASNQIECVPLGGFEQWSKTAREPLIWLKEADPVASMDAEREADPVRIAAQQLMKYWKQVIGVDKAVSVRGIINKANETNDLSQLHRFPEFRAFLIEQAGTGRGDGIDNTRLGIWLQDQHGRVYDGFRIRTIKHKGRPNDYMLEKVVTG
jgi:putative DNA primase/helicase